MKVIFIDGYNVINSWGKLKELKDTSLESAREELVNMMQNYVSFKGCKMFIVFDGHKVPKNVENKEKFKNLTVVYTKEEETADSYIEKSINDLGRRVDISVVTSDSMEQLLVFQRGAARISCQEFYHEVEETERSIKKKTEKKFLDGRNNLYERLEKNVLEKLEKIRRSR